MKLYIYHKTIEDITIFDQIMNLYADQVEEIQIISENRRSYRELEYLLNHIDIKMAAVAIADLSSLGLSTEDIINHLNWFIDHDIPLFICKYPTTYEYGIAQPMNKIVLTTLLQSALNTNKDIVEIPRKKRGNAGRKKVAFPDNWDELYEKWKKYEITSAEFIEKTGLKKATFYNMLAEYNIMLKEQDRYIKKYSKAK